MPELYAVLDFQSRISPVLPELFWWVCKYSLCRAVLVVVYWGDAGWEEQTVFVQTQLLITLD